MLFWFSKLLSAFLRLFLWKLLLLNFYLLLYERLNKIYCTFIALFVECELFPRLWVFSEIFTDYALKTILKRLCFRDWRYLSIMRSPFIGLWVFRSYRGFCSLAIFLVLSFRTVFVPCKFNREWLISRFIRKKHFLLLIWSC